MKTLLIYHRADDDGKLSREICLKYLRSIGDAVEVVGWDYGDATPDVDGFDSVWMVDISIDALMGDYDFCEKLVWIDHHKTAIEKWHAFWSKQSLFGGWKILGLRVDGIAACRLAWAYCEDVVGVERYKSEPMPGEPMGVFMVGLRDVWAHVGTKYEESCNHLRLSLVARQEHVLLLDGGRSVLEDMIQSGKSIGLYDRALMAEFQDRAAHVAVCFGLRLLILNTPGRGSGAIDASSKALLAEHGEKSHDALMVWCHAGSGVVVASLYHASHRKDLDLSVIAKSMGGGGHRGACGFQTTLANMNTLLSTQ